MINKKKIFNLLKKEFYDDNIQEIIKKIIFDLNKSSKNINVQLINDRILKIEKQTIPSVELCFGFPFPLVAFREYAEYDNFKITYHIQGVPVRKMQTNEIAKMQNINLSYLSSKKFFKKTLIHLNTNYDEILFIEPYRFIGDSFMSLQITDTMESIFNLFIKKFSYNNIVSNTLPFCKINPLEYIKNKKNIEILIIQPDFIDDQFTNTKYLIETISELDCKVVLWVLGRNITIEKHPNKSNMTCFKKEGKDIILWNNNIEFVLEKSLDNFIGKQIATKPYLEIKLSKYSLNILINPHTSNINKDINNNLLKIILEINAQRIYLLDTKKLNNINSSNKNIEIIQPTNLQESYNLINNSSIVLTADTAIAHIANRLGKLTFVFYNFDTWDNNNFISTIHNSFLGFASKNLNFLPILINNKYNNILHFIHSIIDIYYQNDYSIELISCIDTYINKTNNLYSNIYEYRIKVIYELSKISSNIILLNDFYFNLLPSKNISLENNIPNINLLIEILSPLYKISLYIQQKHNKS